jgi:beta-galactosidase
VDCALGNGFAAQLDIPGFNYRANRYEEAYTRLPQNVVLGSETASTVSSRGIYKLPARLRANATYDDHQCSGYDLEYCWWSNTPDHDFANADDHEWEIGQFVWTGFDYLGEPSPYDTNAWPSHSSVFGIIDIASLPKDRYYLYRSLWNKREHTLHLLPHWTWPGHEGKIVPVFVYTDAPEAELFINGKSQGIQHKYSREEALAAKEAGDTLWLQRRYRLMWMDTRYEPGEVKVVAHYPDGTRSEKIVRTAGRPHHLELVPDRSRIQADGEDLAYVTVRVCDKDGNLVPDAAHLVQFKVKGAGRFRAAANGDAANLDLFHLPQHHVFAGQLTALVQAADQPGAITLEATAKGLKKATLTLVAQ